MAEFKLKAKIKAYSKVKVPSKISDLENDLDFISDVTQEGLYARKFDPETGKGFWAELSSEGVGDKVIAGDYILTTREPEAQEVTVSVNEPALTQTINTNLGIDGIKTDVSDIKTDVSSIKTNIRNLQQSVTDLEDDLETESETREGQIQALEDDISEINSSLPTKLNKLTSTNNEIRLYAYQRSTQTSVAKSDLVVEIEQWPN